MMKHWPSLVVQNKLFLLSLTVLLAACESPKAKFDDLPMEFTEAEPPTIETPFYNWHIPPQQVEEELRTQFIAGAAVPSKRERPEAGTSGARKYEVTFPDIQQTAEFKWKPVPPNIDQLNNSPRREVAAYEIQKLFLDPEDYVVPTTYVICDPAREKGDSLWPGTTCALGVASLWLKNIERPEVLYDSSRFVKDPVYAHYMSNLNLFTYLIGHGDGNPDNFLVSDNDERRQVFSIDNGVALGHIPNTFVLNWDLIRVPALRKDSIDRLRELERADLDFLAVVEELKLDERRVYIPVASPGESMAAYQGFMEREGTIQFGLRPGEIDAVWSRIQSVIADVDSGRIEVF